MIDVAAERRRLAEARAKLESDGESLRARLDNPGFVASAPSDVVAQTKERVGQLGEERRKIDDALNRIHVDG